MLVTAKKDKKTVAAALLHHNCARIIDGKLRCESEPTLTVFFQAVRDPAMRSALSEWAKAELAQQNQLLANSPELYTLTLKVEARLLPNRRE
jgi:hypothetical protein